MSNLLTRERKTKSIKLRRMMIKEFKNELRNLKIILDEIGKLDTIRQQQVIDIDEMFDEIEELKELIKNLTILSVKNNIEEEKKFINAARKMISRLKAESECKQELIMQKEFETGEILSALYSKELKALDELHVKEIKLEK